MGLIGVIIPIIGGLAMAAVLVLIGAIMLRDHAPKRARLVIWSLIGLVIVYVGLGILSEFMPYEYSQTLETIALILGVPLAVAVVAGTVSLLIPMPDQGTAVGLIVGGLACLGIAFSLCSKSPTPISAYS